MTKQWALGICVALLLLLGCVALMALCGLSVWPKARTPPVDTLDLMLDLSVFPGEWDLCLGPAPLPKRERGERESLSASFCPQDFGGIGGTYQEVYRYRNALDAAILFQLEFSGRGFSKWYMTSPWIVPAEWSYESPAADRFKFACGEVDVPGRHWKCKAVAQYDEYISVFVTHLSPEDMTLQDVEQILAAIDERMALFLGKDMG